MRLPAIVVNFKLNEQSTGKNAVKVAKILEDISIERDVEIVIAVSPLDIYRCKLEVDIPIFAQHVDAVDYGSKTGHINLEAIKEAGAVGTLVNHSENRLKLADIEYIVHKARNMSLETIVCTNNVATSAAIATLSPDFVAVEPPELIGGDISVSKAQPEIIENTVKAVKKVNDIPVLCGAGVKDDVDVKKALELGSKGILVASGVVKAKNIYNATNNLVDGLLG